MDAWILWPEVLLSSSFSPLEAPNGLRAIAVRLGRWWSRAGFPWDVSVAPLRWGAGPDASSHPMNEAGLLVPSLIVTPLPWARPSDMAVAEFDAWLRSRGARAAWAGADATWEPLRPTPERLSELRLETLGTLDRIALHVSPGDVSDGVGDHRLERVGAQAPWVFLLSDALRARLAGAVGFDGPRSSRDTLAAGHQWLWARSAGDGGPAQVETEPTKDDLGRGIFEVLARRHGSARVHHQKIANYLNALPPQNVTKAGLSMHRERRRAWARRLDAMDVRTVLVPLPRVPFEPGLTATDPAPGAWAMEWLEAGRAPQLLRMVFGRQIDRMAWCSEPGRLAIGLVPFSDRGWIRRVVREPDEARDCARVEWVRIEDNPGCSDVSVGASRGATTPTDVGEYFRSVVAPGEREAHGAERYLTQFTAAVRADVDLAAVRNRLAAADALAREYAGPIWQATADVCALHAAARVLELDAGLEGEAGCRLDPADAVIDAVSPGPPRPARHQTGRDLEVYISVRKEYPHATATMLGVTKVDIKRALAVPSEPLTPSMHTGLLRLKALEEQDRADHGRPAPDWERAIDRGPVLDAGRLTGADLRRWRGDMLQDEAARRLGVTQGCLSKAEGRPTKALSAALDRKLSAVLDRGRTVADLAGAPAAPGHGTSSE